MFNRLAAGEGHRKVLFVSLPRLPASHKRCKVAWFGDAGGSETIETIPNIILIRIIPTTTWKKCNPVRKKNILPKIESLI